MVAEALSWKKMGCLGHPQTIPLALRSQLELKSQIVPSHQAPSSPLCGGSIQPFVWCGDEIRPQPNLEAPLAVTVYTVTNSHLNSLLQLFLFLFLYLSTPLVWYLCSRLVASVWDIPSLYMKTSSVVTVTKHYVILNIQLVHVSNIAVT